MQREPELGLCVDHTQLFQATFEGSGYDAEAKSICRACPVREKCLDDALRYDPQWGVQGAMTARERRRLKRRRAAERREARMTREDVPA